MAQTVIQCDENGARMGEIDRMKAHTGKGTLHRAFSVFVFHPETAKLLIQRRSPTKMLWPSIWANTCCSHLRPGETIVEAGQSRLQEELGFSCPLQEGPMFVYRAEDAGRGVEHECDTILLGMADPEQITANADEVSEWKWIAVDELADDMKRDPRSYAPWLHLALAMILRHRKDPHA